MHFYGENVKCRDLIFFNNSQVFTSHLSYLDFYLYISEYVHKPRAILQKRVIIQAIFPISHDQGILQCNRQWHVYQGAANKFGLPEATLRNRVSGKIGVEVIKSGREPLLNLEEENCLVQHIKVMASCGYGYSRSEVVDMASNYAVALGKRDRDHPFSLMWFHNFMKRWPDLKVRKPRSLELARAKTTSEEAVSSYFKELDNILTKYDLKKSPERIYNIDEKGLKLNYTPPKIVAGTDSGDAPPPAVTPGKGETVTVIGCGNALGQQIPPFFIFPGQRMRQELLAGSTPGTDGTMSPKGWSNMEIFMSYLTNHFPKYAQGRSKSKPILVLYDGHRSHISLLLIDWARNHNIHLFILPAHTSHVLQPLDIGCFGPFERVYNADCHMYMREHSCTGVDKYSICGKPVRHTARNCLRQISLIHLERQGSMNSTHLL